MSEDNTTIEETPARETPPSVAEGGTPMAGTALSKEELNVLRRDIVAQLKTVHDPEIPVDIYELGLIYKIDIDDEKNVSIEMTLTTPNCPVAEEMPANVQMAVAKAPDVRDVKVNLVFDPPWDQSLMSEEAQVALNMF